jgi:AcrR family transcriptional regulator
MSSTTARQYKKRVDTLSSAGSKNRILDAALRLIRARGDARVTMARIAKAARLSRQAVYLHFADRAALMIAAARRQHERLGLPADMQRLMNAPTGIKMLEEMVSLQTRRNPDVWAVARAVDAVRRTDAAAERAWQDRVASRLATCRAVVSRLEAENSLRPGLEPSVAADLLWTMMSLRMWEELVLERGWSTGQFQRHVSSLLIGALTSSCLE